MRKITMEAVRAFDGGYNFKKQNTEVNDHGYFLHGNKIAEYTSLLKNDGNKNINITLAGWNTNTTRERLNGLRGVKITTKQGQAYLNGKEWDGSWATILPGGEWIQDQKDEKNDGGIDRLKTVGIVALMGDIFHKGDCKAGNDWKARMLKAGLEGRGLIMPDDWETLSEEEKQSRLDGAINELI